MTNALTTQKQNADQIAGPLAIRSEAARKYARASKSDRTLTLYAAAWREFERFASEHGETPLPASPALVIDYLVALAEAGAKVSTIDLKRAAIVHVHDANNLQNPTAYAEVKAVMGGIRREVGSAPEQKEALSLDDLRTLVNALPDDLAGKRDRALLLVGFAGAFRRSELAALNVADVHINGALRVTIRKSKTDQEARGLVKVIPAIADQALDPMNALRDYLNAADIQSGAIFRRFNSYGVTKARLTAQSVALIVKRAAQRAGIDARLLSGHSLRAGFVTAAYNAGARDNDIMELTGHKSRRTLDKYIRNAGKGAQAAVKAAFGQQNGA
jgi:site-specific recombinase XerD